jgi:hypothetical protein
MPTMFASLAGTLVKGFQAFILVGIKAHVPEIVSPTVEYAFEIQEFSEGNGMICMT